MTRAHLGLIPLNALLLCAGFALLWGIGLVAAARDVLRYAGLALVLGWAALGLLATLALVAGASLSVPQVTAQLVVLALVGVALRRLAAGPPLPAVGEPGRWHWVAVAGITVLGVQLLSLLRRSLSATATIEWDAWAFWLPKAKAILAFGGLDTGPGGFTSLAHPHYPPLVPALEAVTFRFLGEVSPSLLPLQHWVVAVAALGGLAALLSARVRPAVLWPALAALALLPMLVRLIGSSLGDEPLALLLALAGVCAGLWLLGGDARHAGLAAVFLAAAAVTKAEGLPLALAVAGLVLIAGAARPPRRVAAPAAMLLVPISAVLPWRLWLRANDVATAPDYALSDLADPGFLAERIDRLTYAAAQLPGYVFDPGRWLLAVPLFLAAALLAAAVRPALVFVAAGSVAAGFAGLLLVYWIGRPEIEWYVETSAARAVASPVVLAAALLPLLVGELWPAEREPPP
jgi:hypothetical protein